MPTKRRTKRKSSRRRRISGGNQSLAPSVVSGIGRRRRRKTYHPVKRHKRRSRIGAMDNTMQTILGVVGGAVAGVLITKFAPVAIKGKMLSAGKTAAGALIAYTGRKNPLVLGLGMGLAANGATEAVHDFGLINAVDEFMQGIGQGSDEMRIEMNGLPENSMIIGTNQNALPPVISGDEYMNGQSSMPSLISGQ